MAGVMVLQRFDEAYNGGYSDIHARVSWEARHPLQKHGSLGSGSWMRTILKTQGPHNSIRLSYKQEAWSLILPGARAII